MSVKKERPILFSTPMVQAILNGTKTQTRRVLKSKINIARINHNFIAEEEDGKTIQHINCHYGQVGDILWVRETFAKIDENKFIYKANENQNSMRWKPSIHMPKAAARIFLEITEIKVERLQDISEEDAISEGIERINGVPFVIRYKNYGHPPYNVELEDAASSFMTLWWRINGIDSWDLNPWVWVVKFKVIKP